MKIKIFVAHEIQYFEIGIFSFNSYAYYLTCGFIAPTRAFNLLTRAFNLPTRAFNLATRAFNLATRVFSLLTRGFELVTRGFEFATRESELVTRGFELVTRGFKLVTCELELVTRGFEFVTRGFELVTRVLLFHFWHRCFAVNFVKLLRTPIFVEHLPWLLVTLEGISRRVLIFWREYIYLLVNKY